MSSLETMELGGLVWLQDIWKSPIKVVVLTNLRKLGVYNCNRLTHIFPVMVVRNLPQLSNLTIRWCEKLEQIIVNDGEKIDKEILMFPQLQRLHLARLPSLKSFSPVGYHLVFPSLDSIQIQDCSQMLITSFILKSTLPVDAKMKVFIYYPLLQFFYIIL